MTAPAPSTAPAATTTAAPKAAAAADTASSPGHRERCRQRADGGWRERTQVAGSPRGRASGDQGFRARQPCLSGPFSSCFAYDRVLHIGGSRMMALARSLGGALVLVLSSLSAGSASAQDADP
jgi:hypothetical protein